MNFNKEEAESMRIPLQKSPTVYIGMLYFLQKFLLISILVVIGHCVDYFLKVLNYKEVLVK